MCGLEPVETYLENYICKRAPRTCSQYKRIKTLITWLPIPMPFLLKVRCSFTDIISRCFFTDTIVVLSFYFKPRFLYICVCVKQKFYTEHSE